MWARLFQKPVLVYINQFVFIHRRPFILWTCSQSFTLNVSFQFVVDPRVWNSGKQTQANHSYATSSPLNAICHKSRRHVHTHTWCWGMKWDCYHDRTSHTDSRARSLSTHASITLFSCVIHFPVVCVFNKHLQSPRGSRLIQNAN